MTEYNDMTVLVDEVLRGQRESFWLRHQRAPKSLTVQ